MQWDIKKAPRGYRTVARAGVKFMMSAFVYNLAQLRHLAHRPLT